MGRLTTFELDNFDNYAPTSSNFESTFKAKLTLGRKEGNSKGKQIYSEEEDDADENLEIIEALLAKRVSKGKGKFKGKIPWIFFSCEEVDHIVVRFPNKEDKDEKINNRFKFKKDFKNYKD